METFPGYDAWKTRAPEVEDCEVCEDAGCCGHGFIDCEHRNGEQTCECPCHGDPNERMAEIADALYEQEKDRRLWDGR